MATRKPNRIAAEGQAHRLWKLYGFTSPQQLMLEDLAMAMGILVVTERLETAAARLVRTKDVGVIRVSDAIREPGRRRFAIAHELGHWLMHKDQSSLLACADEDILSRYSGNPMEVEASMFAGSLLMPADQFRARARGKLPTTQVIDDLSDHFGTSRTATALRFVETSDDYYVIVVSENGRIKWWRASGSFGDHNLWLDAKTKIPARSSAAAYFRGEVVQPRPQPMDLKDWLGDMPGVNSDTVIEQIIPLSSYGQVISLLWLP